MKLRTFGALLVAYTWAFVSIFPVAEGVEPLSEQAVLVGAQYTLAIFGTLVGVLIVARLALGVVKLFALAVGRTVEKSRSVVGRDSV